MTVTNERIHIEQTQDCNLDYLLYLPEDYDVNKSFPLILFLHGAGERGDDIEQVKVHGPFKHIERGEQMPFIIAGPQCPLDQSWFDYSQALITLIDKLCETYTIDPKRIYLTGISMGGFGSWDLARQYPERFAAVAPICGGMKWLVDVDRAAKQLKNVPIWTFHGVDDKTVPIELTQRMVDALEEFGGDVEFTQYPGVEHDSWTVTYENPKLYEWFLAHSLD